MNAFVWLRDGIGDATVLKGLRMVCNLTKGTLSTFEDDGVPVSNTDTSLISNLTKPRTPLKPLRAEQRAGSSVSINGNLIAWDKWKLRVGVDPRRGLEIHDVSFSDASKQRSVLYSGSLSEIVAPYGDSAFGTWYPRDEGDYGMGIYSMSSAVELNDAPTNTTYLAATMHDARGRPITVPRAIAIYERDGGILWRHANTSRRARQLVISGFSTIDNYDYQFNWILSQDGAIEGEVVLSGMMNVNATARMIDTAHVDGHVAFGHLVAPGINAPNHQHFFSYRLDLDVDGVSNTVYELNSQAPPAAENPKGELFSMSERVLASEQAAFGDVSFKTARAWRVANTHATNSLGQFTGYSLVPGAVAPAFAPVGSEPQRTAGFIDHQLWVTPYAPGELYAAGEFQNLGRDGEGLPGFTKGDRNIKDTDVVLWYTLGITHIARPEDWPLMPTHRGGFKLLPTSFFSKSPVLDVPVIRP